jgi:mono/diheme cytochrome c family protein
MRTTGGRFGIAAGLAVAIATFAVVMALAGGDEQSGSERSAGGGSAGGWSGGERAATGPAPTAPQGRDVFVQMGCGSCHSLAAAGSSGVIGPDLDERLRSHDAASLKAVILDPPGVDGEFSPMPENFGSRMSDAELDALVTFLLGAAR